MASPRSIRLAAGLAAAAIALAAAPSSATGQTIYWGNAVGQGLADSTDEPLTASWNFELGVFKPGFIPTADNIPNWVANWVPLDKAKYNDTAKYFSSKMPAIEPQHAGLQAYIWVYNERKYDSSSEWMLITDRDGSHSNDWMLPNPSAEPTAAVLNWRISQATLVLMGRADRVAKVDAIGKPATTKVYATARIPEGAIAAATAEPEPAKPAAVIAGEVEEEFAD